MSYKVAKPDEVRVKDLVVYPKQSGNRLSLHLAYPVEVGSGMTWTVYVDAVTGEELEVRQNFNT
ncbi:MAG: PepSY domain-containing protein [Acidobacteria bacterium]|nr:PepSY domain-containing protein [Acidobacteriota bacterium]